MRYILLSIRPQWTCKILNGDKTIEVRRGTTLYNAINKLTREQGKAPCLIYCTKGEPYLYQCRWFGSYFVENDKETYGSNYINGKVVAMFEASANEIIESEGNYGLILPCGESISCWKKDTRLSLEELRGYLKDDNGTAIRIHNLKIFDEPKELRNYFMRDKKGDIPVQVEELKGSKFMAVKRIERAPQSWCYVDYIEVDE